jgi:hypothetical protein
MASFGKLTNAFLQASQENTVAFANLNFDFTLIKFEAPEEYRGLGEALTSKRRASAEDGSAHITARKLAALFQSVIPDVPGLVQAYGRRASEVAKLPMVNASAQPSERLGIFADHVGADGTTIWAAATSGRDAIPMHLLACMLARIWRREEAVPIWCELVEQRKAFLQNQMAEGPIFRLSDSTATRIDITRKQLDEWDASARAWLQTADEAKKREQIQFKLVGDNLSLPLPSHDSLYESIVKTWTVAMQSLEDLIKGKPQCIDNGAALLGLAAWHLYPDLCLAGTNQYIRQGDPLIASGGIVTLGLKNKDHDGMGVFWSLPLSLARYYGNPVVAKRHAGISESRVTFDEFQSVVLGSVISGWSAHHTTIELEDQLNFLTRLVDEIPNLQDPDRNWLCMLSEAAQDFLRSDGVRRQHLKQLISFGQRRAGTLLAHHKYWPSPVFGVTKISRILDTMGNREAEVDFLHQWALMTLPSEMLPDAIIRYRSNRYAPWNYMKIRGDTPGVKRQRTDAKGGKMLNIRWIDESSGNDEDLELDDIHEDAEFTASIPPEPGAEPELYDLVGGNLAYAAVFVGVQDRRQRASRKKIMTFEQLLRALKEGWVTIATVAKSLVGILNHYSTYMGTYFLSLRALNAARHLYHELPGAKVDLQVTSRTASVAKWWKTYLEVDRAEVKVTRQQDYALNEDTIRSFKIVSGVPLSTTWSCIAYFESGGINVDPYAIGSHTFAMCYSTSIFVAKSLLSDPMPRTPGEKDKHISINHIERIFGNVGKPGLTFLVTPRTPKLPALDYSSWHKVAHEPFDGQAQDNFQQTSFHLSFTGYEIPLEIGDRGRCDVLASVLETAVSVYDKGDWVGDIDVLSAGGKWAACPPIRLCPHQATDESSAALTKWSLISIDSWPELLDLPPFQDAIVRAHGNPIARLALAALAITQRRTVLILPGEGNCCWQCARDLYWEERLKQRAGKATTEPAGQDQDSELPSYSGPYSPAEESDEVYAFHLPPLHEDDEGQSRDGEDDVPSSKACVLIY